MVPVNTNLWVGMQSFLSLIMLTAAKCSADDFCQGKRGLFVAPAGAPGNIDCRGFYQCFHGHENMQLCPSGQRFNGAIKNCDWAVNVECNLAPTTTFVTTTMKQWRGPAGDSSQVFLGYFSNWFQWTPEPHKFLPSDIQAAKITHINFAFAMLGSKDYVVDGRAAPFEIRYFEDNDVTNNGAPNAGWDQPCGDQCSGCKRGLYEQVNDLKETFPHLRTLISVGGWGMNTPESDDPKNAQRLRRLDAGWNVFVFSDMVSSATNRALFIKSAIKFCRTWNFDGLDLDWEYPGYLKRGGRSTDKANFAILLKELKAAFVAEATESDRPVLLLTAAVGVGPKTASDAYDVAALDENLDFINLMTYDMYGGWAEKTGIHSQLHAGPGDEFPGVNPGEKVPLGGSWAVDWWISQGARPTKLNLGLATYSRSFTLASSEPGQGPGAAATGYGAAQPVSQTPGTAAYYEMLDLISKGAQHTFDPQRCGAYLQIGNLWMGFDDEDTMMCKARYIKDKGLLGGFLWDLPEDDFQQGSPLISTFSEALFSPSSSTTSTLPTSTSLTTITTTKWESTSVTTSIAHDVLQSGDMVFLKAHTGKYLGVEDEAVDARWNRRGVWQGFAIEKKDPALPIHSGDIVYLKAHTGKFVDIEGGAVRARYADDGAWQAFRIEKDGSGPICRDDVVFFQGFTSNQLHVEDESVYASWGNRGAWESFIIEREDFDVLQSDDAIFLKAHTGKHVHVEGDTVSAKWYDRSAWQELIIQRKDGGAIHSGDLVYLEAHTGRHIDVQDGIVRARWHDQGTWQAFIIEKENGGFVHPGDKVFLRAHTGNHIHVNGVDVMATWDDHGLWQSFVIDTGVEKRRLWTPLFQNSESQGDAAQNFAAISRGLDYILF